VNIPNELDAISHRNFVNMPNILSGLDDHKLEFVAAEATRDLHGYSSQGFNTSLSMVNTLPHHFGWPMIPNNWSLTLPRINSPLRLGVEALLN
jgi:hypothetical protein